MYKNYKNIECGGIVMSRHISTSQLKSQLRQIEQKQKRAIADYNRVLSEYNTEINKSTTAYNSFVREFNSSVCRNRYIIEQEMRKLNTRTAVATSYTASMHVMQQHYQRVNAVYREGVDITPEQDQILDLIEQEQANSLLTANAITNEDFSEESTEDVEIGNKLQVVSEDLNNRWKGAVYALNPSNPDAARHFCTSAREIFTEFIELKAPDNLVFQYNPQCEKTDRGNATRREKIKYMMRKTPMDDSVIDYAEADITNILELFHVLSDGTHGAAGRYEFPKLMQVKKRVEQGINFLCEISS